MPEILLVIRKRGNIRVLRQALEAHKHTCVEVSNKEALERLLEKPLCPDLALVDTSGFGESIKSMYKLLQRKEIPFIVLSAKRELSLSSQALYHGATSILEKPIIKPLLLKFIRRMVHAGAC